MISSCNNKSKSSTNLTNCACKFCHIKPKGNWNQMFGMSINTHDLNQIIKLKFHACDFNTSKFLFIIPCNILNTKMESSKWTLCCHQMHMSICATYYNLQEHLWIPTSFCTNLIRTNANMGETFLHPLGLSSTNCFRHLVLGKRMINSLELNQYINICFQMQKHGWLVICIIFQ